MKVKRKSRNQKNKDMKLHRSKLKNLNIVEGK